jgi:hypothetical protein
MSRCKCCLFSNKVRDEKCDCERDKRRDVKNDIKPVRGRRNVLVTPYKGCAAWHNFRSRITRLTENKAKTKGF